MKDLVKESNEKQSRQSSEVVKDFTDLRSQGGFPVTWKNSPDKYIQK